MAYQEVSVQKLNFFRASYSENSNIFDTLQTEQSFVFLQKNLKLIQSEFDHLFSLLKNDPSIDHKAFYAYCYHCAQMLKAYHEAYDQHEKAAFYQKACEALRNHFKAEGDVIPKPQLKTIEGSIRSGINELLDMSKHLAKARSAVGLLNVNRIYWIFCRLTISQSLLLLKETPFLKSLDQILNQTTDIDNLIKTINLPNPALVFASVGLFVTRFMMHTAMVVKHTFNPSEKEKEASMQQRFLFEINKRHYDYLNDLVWGSVNILTNFAPRTGISTYTAGFVTAGFMSFDFLMMMYRKYHAHQDYLEKKNQYQLDLAYFEEISDPIAIRLTKDALIKLDIEWNATRETFNFNAAAALIIMSGFTASLFITHPFLLGALYFQAMVGVSMYLTGDNFMALRKKELLACSSLGDAQSQVDAQNAHHVFVQDFLKQVMVPPFVIMAYALSWPLALAGTVGYFSYQSYQSAQSQALEIESSTPNP